jgi:hypothetical protein
MGDHQLMQEKYDVPAVIKFIMNQAMSTGLG